MLVNIHKECSNRVPLQCQRSSINYSACLFIKGYLDVSTPGTSVAIAMSGSITGKAISHYKIKCCFATAVTPTCLSSYIYPAITVIPCTKRFTTGSYLTSLVIPVETFVDCAGIGAVLITLRHFILPGRSLTGNLNQPGPVALSVKPYGDVCILIRYQLRIADYKGVLVFPALQNIYLILLCLKLFAVFRGTISYRELFKRAGTAQFLTFGCRNADRYVTLPLLRFADLMVGVMSDTFLLIKAVPFASTLTGDTAQPKIMAAPMIIAPILPTVFSFSLS